MFLYGVRCAYLVTWINVKWVVSSDQRLFVVVKGLGNHLVVNVPFYGTRNYGGAGFADLFSLFEYVCRLSNI